MFNTLKIFTDRETLLDLCVGLFVFSLTQKTYCINNDCGEFWSGLSLLFTGWMGIFFGGAGFCWLANPLIILSWFLLRKNTGVAILLSGIATVCTLTFLSFDSIIADEGGGYKNITGYGLGYWLWMLSSLMTFIGNIIIEIRAGKVDTQFTE